MLDQTATQLLEQTTQTGLAAIVARPGDQTDELLESIISQLQHEGYHLTGLRQRAVAGATRGCGIRLQDIATGELHRITQYLGTGSTSCNIDTEAVEHLAMKRAMALDRNVDLVIVNRFGKREAEGGGFCCVVESAVELGIPVLTVVKEDWLPNWLAYGGECVSTLRPDRASVENWCHRILPVLAL